MSRYRAVVIGTGRIGLTLETDGKRLKPATHAGMWAGHAGTELVGMADVDPIAGQAAARLFPEIPFFTDPEDMLGRIGADIVSIATAQDTHVPLMRLAAANGAKAIICEKPIADDPDEACAVVDELEAAGIILIINHARRFDPVIRRLAERIKAGDIGEVLQISGTYVYGLVSTGTHLIDTIRMMLPVQAGRACRATAWHNRLPVHHPDGDPCIDGVVEFTSGIRASIQSLSMKDYDHLEITVFGRRGVAKCHDLARRAAIYPVVPSGRHGGFQELSEQASDAWGPATRSYFSLLADHVIACIEGRAKPASSGADGVIALRVLAAMRRSADTGGLPVDIDER